MIIVNTAIGPNRYLLPTGSHTIPYQRNLFDVLANYANRLYPEQVIIIVIENNEQNAFNNDYAPYNSFINSLIAKGILVITGSGSGSGSTFPYTVSFAPQPNAIPQADSNGLLHKDYIPEIVSIRKKKLRTYTLGINNSNKYYNILNISGNYDNTLQTNFIMNDNVLYLIPFYSDTSMTITQIGFLPVADYNSTTANFGLGIYTVNENNNTLSNLLWDTGISTNNIVSNQPLLANANVNISRNKLYYFVVFYYGQAPSISVAGVPSAYSDVSFGVSIDTNGIYGISHLTAVPPSGVPLPVFLVNISMSNFSMDTTNDSFPLIIYRYN